jgi:radical SAM superfamily enzyme YgiQ (UPF0313 family)
MKVLLINTPTSFEQIYGDWDLTGLDTFTPPLGLLHIASYIREFGHEPCIMDFQSTRWNRERLVESIMKKKPDIVGLSAMTINCLNVDRIGQELKKRGFSSPIVLGGAHISAVPEETLERFRSIDFGVIGEGEVTFLEIIETIEKGKSVEDIRGVVWRDNNGRIKINETRKPIENLDMLPLPAWDLLDNFPKNYPHSLLESKRLPAAAIMTSRGCPFDCTFCDHRVFGSRVRHFSADYTLEMIKHLVDRYKIKDMMILDDNFLLDRKKVYDVCNGMISENMDLTWYCIAHAKSVTADKVAKIKDAGCWFIELGIESGNEEILRNIKKNTNKAEFAEAARISKKAGLKVKGNFIFGFPGDTLETLEETIQFALDCDIDHFQQNFLTVWPGCEIYYQLMKNPYSYEYYENNWGILAHQRVTFVPKGLTKMDLVKASKKANRKFYLRPKIIFGIMPLLFSLRGLKIGFVAMRVFLKTIFGRK